jgi:hypothetical protein
LEQFEDWQVRLWYPFQNNWSNSYGDKRDDLIAPREYVEWTSATYNLNVVRSKLKDQAFKSFLSEAFHKDRIFFVNAGDVYRWLSLAQI